MEALEQRRGSFGERQVVVAKIASTHCPGFAGAAVIANSVPCLRYPVDEARKAGVEEADTLLRAGQVEAPAG